MTFTHTSASEHCSHLLSCIHPVLFCTLPFCSRICLLKAEQMR